MDANTSGLGWPLAEHQAVSGVSRSCEVDSESVSKQTDEGRTVRNSRLKLNMLCV